MSGTVNVPQAGSDRARGQQPPRDERQRARAARRTAILLGLVAFGIYSWFILRHVLRTPGAVG